MTPVSSVILAHAASEEDRSSATRKEIEPPRRTEGNPQRPIPTEFLRPQAAPVTVPCSQIDSPRSIDSGLDRLRRSRATSEDRRRSEGRADGKHWALEVAEFEDIERVVAAVGNLGEDAQTARFALAVATLDDEAPGLDYVESEMQSLFGRKSPTLAEGKGFLDAVMEVHAEI